MPPPPVRLIGGEEPEGAVANFWLGEARALPAAGSWAGEVHRKLVASTPWQEGVVAKLGPNGEGRGRDEVGGLRRAF